MTVTSPALSPHAANPAVGVLLVLSAVFVFAGMDTMTKLMATAYNVPLVAAVRYIGNTVALGVVYGPGHGAALWATKRTGLVVLRALCLVVSTLLAGLALTRMPVAETISIIYLAPFAVMLLSGPLLGERVAALGWVAAALGFAGVLLIARPGGGLDGLGVIYALGCAAFTVAYTILSRVLTRSESTMALLFFASLAGTVVFGLFLPWSMHGPTPSALQLAMFVAMGPLAAAGHFLFTAAFRHAPASFLAPFNYMHLFWAGILGWLVFDHVPGVLTLAGMGLVAAAGVAAALAPRQKG